MRNLTIISAAFVAVLSFSGCGEEAAKPVVPTPEVTATEVKPAAPAAIDALLAPSLDSSLFRQELAVLADLCDESGAQSKRARAFEDEARGWIAKLEGDVSTLTQQLTAEVQERQRLAGELTAARAMAQVAERLPPIVKRILARLARNARR